MVRKPNLFIMGAPKCGTTSLAHWLDQHPQIVVSPEKEPNFFNDDMAFARLRDEADYLAHFGPEHPGIRARVDATPWYLASTVAAGRIAQFAPDARLVVLLRDPTEMAVSLHAQLLSKGGEDVADFAAAWCLQEDRLAGRSVPITATEPSVLQYRTICATGTQCERLFEQFPCDQVRLILLDDLRRDPRKVVAEICDWLGIAPVGELDLSPRNQRHHARSRFLRNIVALATTAQSRGLLPRTGTGLGRVVSRLNRRPGSGARVNQSFLASTVRPAFEGEVEIIRRLTGRPLPHWGVARREIPA